MVSESKVGQALHDEHQATVLLMEKLEGAVSRHARSPDVDSDPTLRPMLREIATTLVKEIEHHFDFEEQHLFSRLAEMGDEGIGIHLTGEHMAMRPLASRLAVIARAALEVGFDDESWQAFRRTGAEFAERMFAHVQKEEMALIPIVEELLDSETDMTLFLEHTGNV